MSGPSWFSASSSLAHVLDWPELPRALRRALERTGVDLGHVTFAQSVQRHDARLLEWQVALLALDIGVEVDGRWTNLIGLFSDGSLRTAAVTGFHLPAVLEGQVFGAAAHGATAAAAFLYLDAQARIRSWFVFIGDSATGHVEQLDLPGLDGVPFERLYVAAALEQRSAELHAEQDAHLVGTVREALLDCVTA